MLLWRMRHFSYSSIIAGFLVLLTAMPVLAESYVAGQIGVVLPNDLSNIEITDTRLPAGSKASDAELKNALLYGIKLGHYWNRIRWFGVEMEAFTANPHIKQQDVTVTQPGVPTLTVVPDGAYLQVTTVALNLIARVPGKYLQPYAAVGPAAFIARVTSGDVGRSSVVPGLNAQLGIRYLLTQHWAMFGEWKYNYARFDFEEAPLRVGLNATYTAHSLVFGVGYHF